MNIYNLTVCIPRPPMIDFKSLRKTLNNDYEEYDDTSFVPFNTPCTRLRKRVKYSSNNDLYPFDTIDDFIRFYNEDF